MRAQLKNLVVAGFALLVLGFAYVLFVSLGGGNRVQPAWLTELQPGQTIKRYSAGQRIWVTRLSEEQLGRLDQAQAFIIDAQSGCVSRPVCSLAADSGVAGIDIVYSQQRPPQLASEITWVGGYVNPVSGQVFDLLGRAFNRQAYSASVELVIDQLQPVNP